ncbi:Gfo/Idh/MocA family protein [Hoeflea poritis]|uniref:Gfo/Idh/MocA family oxidoreductase n=1 Tax=Hoeflea poritis TaxID=2993659 RepID=A0ABT4VRZ7_9HYPH|nr:Gfo/Idh/MocA family oxidoreductase [Hoeflea poritis]MDA4847487.1 Gfo/Idh/MocA family oxidoreductase [Hoeflea poritis]
MSGGRFGIGVIGTGMAAKPHAGALRDLEEILDVRGVFSRNPDKRAAFAGNYGFPIADSIDALADDPELNAAILITPPSERLHLVRRFAEAGKHILMEKPVERTTDAAREIVSICEQNGVRLGIVFQHRFRQASMALKDRIDSGALGAIGLVRISVPWWREQAYYDEPGRGTYARDGGGVLISQAIHTLDLMLSIAGPVAEVQAVAATTPFHRMEAEDFVAGGMRFDNGATGSLMATTAAFPGGAESIAIDCEAASAHLQSGTLTIDWRDGRTETVGEAAGTGGGADPMAFPHDWHRDLIRDFVDAAKSGRDPAVTGREALRVHHLIDALMESSREGRAVKLTANNLN